MSTELFCKIIDDCVEMNIPEVFPFLNGEPMMDTTIVDKIKYINKKLPRAMVGLYTNGHLLDCILDDINDIKIGYMNVSINAANDKDRLKIMGLPLKQTIENVKIFTELSPHTIVIASVIHDPAITPYGKLPEIDRMFRDMKIKGLTFGMANWAGQTRPVYAVDYSCNRLVDQMTVLSTGQVCLCCMDNEGRVNLGDLNKQTVREVWESKARRHLFDMNKQGRRGELRLCKDCTTV